MANPSFSIDDEILEAVNRRLSYGDSRSEWVQEAIRLRLLVESVDDDIDVTEDMEMIQAAVKAQIEKSENKAEGPAD